MKVLIFGVLVSGLLAGNTVAQQASLNGNVVNIPVVTLGEQAYQLELTLVADTSPVELLVTQAVLLADFSTQGASTFNGTTLAVPSLEADGVDAQRAQAHRRPAGAAARHHEGWC